MNHFSRNVRLKRRRELCGLPIPSLAFAAGVAASDVGLYLRGMRRLPDDAVTRLEQVLKKAILEKKELLTAELFDVIRSADLIIW